MSRQSWTNEKIEHLRHLVAEGKTGLEISKSFGITRAAVHQRATANHITFNNDPVKRSASRGGVLGEFIQTFGDRWFDREEAIQRFGVKGLNLIANGKSRIFERRGAKNARQYRIVNTINNTANNTANNKPTQSRADLKTAKRQLIQKIRPIMDALETEGHRDVHEVLPTVILRLYGLLRNAIRDWGEEERAPRGRAANSKSDDHAKETCSADVSN